MPQQVKVLTAQHNGLSLTPGSTCGRRINFCKSSSDLQAHTSAHVCLCLRYVCACMYTCTLSVKKSPELNAALYVVQWSLQHISLHARPTSWLHSSFIQAFEWVWHLWCPAGSVAAAAAGLVLAFFSMKFLSLHPTKWTNSVWSQINTLYFIST